MSEPSSDDAAIRVLLADEHEILRHGLKLLLTLHPEIEVVAEARTGREAIAQVLTLHPDVVVLDISMPDLDGLKACEAICAQVPETSVLILTMHESEAHFFQALHAGATGYLVKKAAPTELHLAILSVARSGAYFSPSLAKSLIHACLALSPGPSPVAMVENQAAHQLRVLTSRQLHVLKLLVHAQTNQEIADHLHISIKTVQAHRASVMERLGQLSFFLYSCYT
jgi:DNA-binding NarL/FixJ family response regulator